jgi:NAD(P)-dependent dehydrogenase (short-subunit alcohol dehydrogenase family)
LNLSGHSALVTGGSSGLGAATAARLLKAGAKVAILDLNLDGAQAIPEAVAIRCDVSDAASAASAVAEAREKIGPPRILVHCAGVAPAKRIVGRDGPMPLEDFAKVIQINLIGTFNMLRLAAAEMTKLEPIEATESPDGERGVIICTASVAAYEGQIGQAAYAASKGGVVSLTLPAARELSQFGVRVLTIAPGIFSTPMIAGMPEEVQKSLSASIPFPKRLGHPEEFAALALHCIENCYLNGEVIRLDGATRMAPR